MARREVLDSTVWSTHCVSDTDSLRRGTIELDIACPGLHLELSALVRSMSACDSVHANLLCMGPCHETSTHVDLRGRTNS